MALDVPTCEPSILRAGDTWRWDRTFADFPVSDGYTLSYAFRSLTATGATSKLTWDAAWLDTSDDRYAVTIPASATAVLAEGTWEWAAFMTLDDARYTAALGRFEVEPNLATAGEGSGQSFAAEALVKVQAEILARITGTGSAHEGYTIGDRSISKLSLKELRDLEASLTARVNIQSRRRGFGQRVLTTFVRPGPSGTPCCGDGF